MTEPKRIDFPCPWCGTRCCKAVTLNGRTVREWACGSKGSFTGTRWQSPTCRNQELDISEPGDRFKTIIKEALGVIEFFEHGEDAEELHNILEKCQSVLYKSGLAATERTLTEEK